MLVAAGDIRKFKKFPVFFIGAVGSLLNFTKPIIISHSKARKARTPLSKFLRIFMFC